MWRRWLTRGRVLRSEKKNPIIATHYEVQYSEFKVPTILKYTFSNMHVCHIQIKPRVISNGVGVGRNLSMINIFFSNLLTESKACQQFITLILFFNIPVFYSTCIRNTLCNWLVCIYEYISSKVVNLSERLFGRRTVHWASRKERMINSFYYCTYLCCFDSTALQYLLINIWWQ